MINRHRVLNSVWALAPQFAQNYLPLVASALQGESTPLAPFDADSVGEMLPNGILRLDIIGAINKYRSCENSGTALVARLIKEADNNDEISAIVLYLDSGGGSVDAIDPIKNAIASCNKPILAFCSSICASAAYWIASCCDAIVAESADVEIGSIGAFTTIIDYKEYYAKLGINIIEIYASASTDKNIEYRQAIEGNISPLQERINRYVDTFHADVARNRKNFTSDEWKKGGIFFADIALEMGLIDGIADFETFINSILL